LTNKYKRKKEEREPGPGRRNTWSNLAYFMKVFPDSTQYSAATIAGRKRSHCILWNQAPFSP